MLTTQYMRISTILCDIHQLNLLHETVITEDYENNVYLLEFIVSDTAIFVLKRDMKLQLTNC